MLDWRLCFLIVGGRSILGVEMVGFYREVST